MEDKQRATSHVVNVTTAKAKFSEIVERVVGGDEIIVSRMGKPVIRIIKYTPAPITRELGTMIGQIEIASDFETWSDDEARALGILD